MNTILAKYSNRLININGRNKSLLMRKLYKKRAFDLIKLKKFDENIIQNLIPFLIQRQTKHLLLLQDPYQWYQEASTNLPDTISMDEKQEMDDKLRDNQDKMISYSTELATLSKEIKNTLKETGRYELYVGYPFIEGCFKDKTFVKAPLFLFPVEIFKKGDMWFIQNKVNQPISLNKVFLVAHAKCNEEKLTTIPIEYNSFDEFGENIIESILTKLKEDNLFIGNPNDEICKFKDILKDVESTYRLGELVINSTFPL